tara:strand:+ start:249 stop:353 length:105 start_codon:yes stop_codon:yes gene_type:complete
MVSINKSPEVSELADDIVYLERTLFDVNKIIIED